MVMSFFHCSSLDMSELAKQAKKKLQAVSVLSFYIRSKVCCYLVCVLYLVKSFVCQLPNHLFEELAMDVYDEVDRRENDERKYCVSR